MSTVINVNTALGKDFVKLSGPENYDAWLKDFEPIANMNGYLGLYLGNDEVVGKPAPPDFVPKVAASTEPTLRTRKIADTEITSQTPNVPDTPENYAYYIAVYNAQVQDWKDNDKNVYSACALLRASVESWIWKDLSTNDAVHPQKT